MKTPADKTPIDAFVVVDTGSNWRVAHLVEKFAWLNGAAYREKDAERIWSAQHILAVFDTREAADDALARSQSLEKQLRPMWQMTVAHELAARNTMMDAVIAELRKGL
jgi:hypothetical protein